MSNLKKSKNVNKSAEGTDMELDGEMSMNTKLISKFITEQGVSPMAKNIKQYEKKIKNWRKVERMECQNSREKTERGALDTPPIKIKIHGSFIND